MPKFSLIHPSRSRVSQARETINNWLSKADNPHNIEYILSLDYSDPNTYEYEGNEGLPSWMTGGSMSLNILRSDNHTAIEAINNAAEIASGDILIVVSDDFLPCEHWDTLLLKEVEGKDDFTVKTQDGIQPILITIPILDRKYYDRFGYIYEPGYFHLWVDAEYTAVAHLLGKVITSVIELKHNHYSKGLSPKDNVNIKNDKTWRQGELRYRSRCPNNFGLKAEDIKGVLPPSLNLR